jgi:hypothetical protein
VIEHLHRVDQLRGSLLGACDHLLQEILVVVVGALDPGVGRGHAEDCEAGGESVLHLEEDGVCVCTCVYWPELQQRMTVAKEWEGLDGQ